MDHAEPLRRQQAVGRRGQVVRRQARVDLRDIRSPIVLFASMGDNITPPQQAFNWIADLYGSTDEIRPTGR